jgi:two-component sensor histidine kinase
LVRIIWRERGRPPVHLPERRSFRSRLLERGLVQEAGDEDRLAFMPEGGKCCIRLPVAEKTASRDAAVA